MPDTRIRFAAGCPVQGLPPLGPAAELEGGERAGRLWGKLIWGTAAFTYGRSLMELAGTGPLRRGRACAVAAPGRAVCLEEGSTPRAVGFRSLAPCSRPPSHVHWCTCCFWSKACARSPLLFNSANVYSSRRSVSFPFFLCHEIRSPGVSVCVCVKEKHLLSHCLRSCFIAFFQVIQGSESSTGQADI